MKRNCSCSSEHLGYSCRSPQEEPVLLQLPPSLLWALILPDMPTYPPSKNRRAVRISASVVNTTASGCACNCGSKLTCLSWMKLPCELCVFHPLPTDWLSWTLHPPYQQLFCTGTVFGVIVTRLSANSNHTIMTLEINLFSIFSLKISVIFIIKPLDDRCSEQWDGC